MGPRFRHMCGPKPIMYRPWSPSNRCESQCERSACHVNLHILAHRRILPIPSPPTMSNISGPSRMALSASSQAAQVAHAAALHASHAKQRARTLAVPTLPQDVITLLRKLGEPITLFGEHAGGRRDRLRTELGKRAIELEMAGEDADQEMAALLSGLQGPASRVADVPADAGASPAGPQTEPIYKPAESSLVEFRESIAPWTFDRYVVGCVRVCACSRMGVMHTGPPVVPLARLPSSPTELKRGWNGKHKQLQQSRMWPLQQPSHCCRALRWWSQQCPK